MTGPDSFTFLNEPGEIATSSDWNDPEKDKLWLYNAHYFDDLNARDADARVGWHQDLIRRWIAENAPRHGNGWEPYPVSLRIVNWIKWDLRTSALEKSAKESLALQLRWLRRRLEYHLLGNHLLANAKALIFGGLYFQGNEADEWFRTGKGIFDAQLKEQILPDGGHFELSPMYHLIMLEDALDVANVLRAYGKTMPVSWLDTTRRVLNWAKVMKHPDGEVPFFNDAAFGIAGTFDDLEAYVSRVLPLTNEVSDTDGIQVENAQGIGPAGCDLRDSGYIRLETNDAVVFFDAAALGPDYLPGHGHADTLSLELSLFGQRVFVNSGTSVYGTGPERLRQRGTDAHNTISIDGENSSEVWSGFRVARRAKCQLLDLSLSEGIVVAQHDGYRRLPERPIHRRALRVSDGFVQITDTIESETTPQSGRERTVQGAWHLHPEVRVSRRQGEDGATEFVLEIPVRNAGGTRTAFLGVKGAHRVAIEESTWHPQFGMSIPSHRVVFRYFGPLPTTMRTELRW